MHLNKKKRKKILSILAPWGPPPEGPHISAQGWNIENLSDGLHLTDMRINPLEFHRNCCTSLDTINLGIDFPA